MTDDIEERTIVQSFSSLKIADSGQTEEISVQSDLIV